MVDVVPPRYPTARSKIQLQIRVALESQEARHFLYG